MYTTIFSVALLIIAGLFVLCGVLRGKKYVWLYSAMRLGAAVVSLVLALILSTWIAGMLSDMVLDLVMDLDGMEDVRGFMKDLPSAPQAFGAILSMILAPILFFVLFFVVKRILYIIVKIVAKVIMKAMRKKNPAMVVEITGKKKKKKINVLRAQGPNPIGMACGAVCSLLVFFVICVPIVGTFGVVDSVVSLLPPEEPVIETVQQITDAGAHNACAQTVSTLGGEAIYNKLTTYEVGGHDVSLLTEVKFVGSIGNAVMAVNDPNVSRTDAAAFVRGVSPAFSESSLVPTLSADFLKAANESWEKGEKYNGIAKPSLGEGMEAITDPLWSLLATSTYDTVKTDVGTVVEVLAIMVEEDAMNKVKTDALSIFKDRELSASILYALLSNDRMSPLVGSIAEYGVQMLGDQLDVDLSKVDLDSSAIADKQAEANALANAFGEAMNLIDDAKGGSFEITESIETVGPLLDAFSATQTVGHDNSAAILSGILQAESVYKKVGFTLEEVTSIANSINEKSKVQGYTPLMRSLSHTIDVVQLASKTDATAKEEMNQKVETLIQDLTPESAEVLQEISSPSVMQNYGVPEQSAESTAGMVSNLFGNLSAAKESGMSEEEYQKEAQATTDLLNLAINRKEGEEGKLFGEDSATGKTASDYVDTVFDSVVVSQTIIETAYPTGQESTPVADPLNTGKSLNENEKTQVLDALNAKWNTATEEEKASEDYQKTYLAIGSLMNVPIQITENGVVIQQQEQQQQQQQ